MTDSEKFTKRVMKWGLLRRVAKPDKPWVFVNYGHCIFDTIEQAFAEANRLNTTDGQPAYLYKPVEAYLTVELE